MLTDKLSGFKRILFGLWEVVVLCADSRFAEPRCSSARGACRPGRDTAARRKNVAAATKSAAKGGGKAAKRQKCCGSNRKMPPRAAKGFNFVRVKLLFGGADSRFGKPRTSRKGTVLFFSLVRKERGVPQRFANLWTPGTIQISARYMTFVETTGVHQVTGYTGYDNLSGYRR